MPSLPTTIPYYRPPKPKEKSNMQYVNPEDEKYKMKDYPTLTVKEQLQRTARAVHDEFVATAIDKIEEYASVGEFEVRLSGTESELIALGIYCRDNDLSFELSEALYDYEILIQWYDR